MDNYVPFPQADDFEKIMTLLNLSEEENISNTAFISKLLDDISDRQVSYYVSALAYLGLIVSDKGKRNFTNLGIKLRNMNTVMQEAEIIAIILHDEVMSKVYVFTKKFGHQDIHDVESIIKEYHPDYSEAIYHRRAQTVISWIDWINNRL